MADNTQNIAAQLAEAEQRVQMLRAQLAQSQAQGGAQPQPFKSTLQGAQPLAGAQAQPMQNLQGNQAQQMQQAAAQRQGMAPAQPGLMQAAPGQMQNLQGNQAQQMQQADAFRQFQARQMQQPAAIQPVQKMVQTRTGMQPMPTGATPYAQHAEMLRMQNMQNAQPNATQMQLDMQRRQSKLYG